MPTGVAEWRILKDAAPFEAAVAQIPALRQWADPERSEAITDVLPTAGLRDTFRPYDPGAVLGLVPVGDAYSHTDPVLAHGVALRLFTACGWAKRVDFTRHDGDDALFSMAAAGAAATVDPDIFRMSVRRIGLLDSTTVLDADVALQPGPESAGALAHPASFGSASATGIGEYGDMAADLLGREELLGRLTALVDRAWSGERTTVLIAGEAGIGKSSLLRATAAHAADRGATVAWGGCSDVVDAPGYWPWTQLLGALVRAVGQEHARELAEADTALLGTIVPGLGEPMTGEDSGRAQLLLMDATVRWLSGLTTEAPVLVILDDLHWADESSVQLLDFVARASHLHGLCVLGAYRGDEIAPRIRDRMAALLAHTEHLLVGGLDRPAVQSLVERIAGRPVEDETADTIHRRSGGHPFFARELALLVASGRVEDVPIAVRGAIDHRLGRLPERTLSVLETAAVIGPELRPDVVAHVLGCPPVEVSAAVESAGDVLTARGGTLSFAHDLLRETLLARIEPSRRVGLHRAVGEALEDRQSRAGDVPLAQLAGHFIAAVAADGPQRAARWALAAARADRTALAFDEAAGRLRRLRAAVADAGAALGDDDLVEVLLVEADAVARAGRPSDARETLRLAKEAATRSGDPGLVARAALAVAQLGAQFAARRDDIVAELERALAAVAGTNDALEARLGATLARELAHSVAEDRPRAGPLSEQALRLGRRSGDLGTVATCLLARHDVLWTPGAAGERARIAGEIAAVAQQCGDSELHAQGLLLHANALLEQGSGAFEAALDSCLAILDRLEQPRHRYTAETRRACLALLRGRLDEADQRIEDAAQLGQRIREPDTGNVRMSQRLELVRARGEPDELREFAEAAVAHWVGAPVHANAVAAGFRARAGDLDAARRHVATVLDLGTWQADRSYLWSVFIRELAHAAVVLDDRELCSQLLADVEPVAAGCGVNGAVVAFAGSHAHTAGRLAQVLGRQQQGRELLASAARTYRRLGAAGWLTELQRAADSSPRAEHSLRRAGAIWELTFDGRHVTVPHAKGLSDIARLIRSGAEVHVLDLVDSADRSGPSGDLADGAALRSYRRRLAELDADLDTAVGNADGARAELLAAERSALLDELGRVAGIGHRARQFANPTERARKAVAARIRDSIRRLELVAPDLAAHLDRSIVTGTYCRYRPDGDTSVRWEISF